MIIDYKEFSNPLLAWFDLHGRKDLPWQHPRSAYRVWISEIMLQQTQVKTVLPYFIRFITRFPDIQTLALAPEDDVLAHWSGLGYYSRARNLHKSAKMIQTEFQGEFPNELDTLLKLPGVGESTAAAIASLAFNKSTAILDGNVKRVLSRYFLVAGLPTDAYVKKTLWALANACMPLTRCADYSQAIMDMGATCCTSKKPDCISCPLKRNCLAYKNNVVGDYPFKKIKKSLPTKHQQFLLLHTKQNRIYLEKRPPTGIWGGLWCLPSIDANICPTQYINQTYALDTQTPKELLKIKHTFSHFHLHILAWSLESKPRSNMVAEETGGWFDIQEIAGLGIAKPVSLIIEAFCRLD